MLSSLCGYLRLDGCCAEIRRIVFAYPVLLVLEGASLSIICFQTLFSNHNRVFNNFMNFIKKTAVTLSIAMSLAVTTTIAFAEEAATAAPAAAAAKAPATAAEVIGHLENAVVEVNKSDFANATLAIRAARSAAETLTGDAETLKKADAIIQRGQVANKVGDVEKATAALNEGIKLFKSL